MAIIKFNNDQSIEVGAKIPSNYEGTIFTYEHNDLRLIKTEVEHAFNADELKKLGYM